MENTLRHNVWTFAKAELFRVTAPAKVSGSIGGLLDVGVRESVEFELWSLVWSSVVGGCIGTSNHPT